MLSTLISKFFLSFGFQQNAQIYSQTGPWSATRKTDWCKKLLVWAKLLPVKVQCHPGGSNVFPSASLQTLRDPHIRLTEVSLPERIPFSLFNPPKVVKIYIWVNKTHTISRRHFPCQQMNIGQSQQTQITVSTMTTIKNVSS